MKYVTVKFINSDNEYEFKTSQNLIAGNTYDIIGDKLIHYTTPVCVIDVHDIPHYSGLLREITYANLVSHKDRIKNVYFNEKKGATCVVWDDGTKTVVHCHEDDAFNKEAGLALCYMKRMLGNNSYFNKVLQKYCGEE